MALAELNEPPSVPRSTIDVSAETGCTTRITSTKAASVLPVSHFMRSRLLTPTQQVPTNGSTARPSPSAARGGIDEEATSVPPRWLEAPDPAQLWRGQVRARWSGTSRGDN